MIFDNKLRRFKRRKTIFGDFWKSDLMELETSALGIRHLETEGKHISAAVIRIYYTFKRDRCSDLVLQRDLSRSIFPESSNWLFAGLRLRCGSDLEVDTLLKL